MGQTEFEYSFKEVGFEYDWIVGEKKIGNLILSDFTNPPTYKNSSGNVVPRDYDTLSGLRIVVDTMVAENKSFDLIELSPRLVADITDRISNVSTEKAVGIIDTLAIPIGGFQAGTGEIKILDYDMSFNSFNTNSILKDLLDRNTSFSIYDNMVVGYKNNYVPVKKLYNEFLEPEVDEYNVGYSLRDAFYRFENVEAPEIILSDVSLSYAVGTLLDLIGHTNYVFKRAEGEAEPRLPYFFVNPESNVAEVLEKLAVATQSAMFFDEYNNFVVMYKDYLLSESSRSDQSDSPDNYIAYFTGDEPEKDEWGVRKLAYDMADGNLQLTDSTSTTSEFPDLLPNIVDIASTEKKVFNIYSPY